MNNSGPTAFSRHGPIGVGHIQQYEVTPNGLRGMVRLAQHNLEWEADGVESSVALYSGNALAQIARRIPPGELNEFTLRSLEVFEPYAPWTREFLALRAQCYEKLGDPRSAAAQRDLKDFDRREYGSRLDALLTP